MDAVILVHVDDEQLAAHVAEFYDRLASDGHDGEQLAPADFVLDRVREAAGTELRDAFRAWSAQVGLTISVAIVEPVL